MTGFITKRAVIPAKAGIHRRASARHKSQTAIQIQTPFDSYARYRSRWIPAFAGMTAVFAMLVFSSLPARADAPALPQTSLFFTPQESRAAEILAQKAQPAGQGDIRLGAVMYYGPHDWTLWLQGEKWTPETSRPDLRVEEVSANEVRLSWRAEDGSGERDFTLKPNQSYQIATGKIIAGP
ncbi:MAG: hypothetical protein P4M13_00120 [Alphaproteobacteria bacterium]|nr:hypothetical protein [Alphaproteobacteria bacterium]